MIFAGSTGSSFCVVSCARDVLTVSPVAPCQIVGAGCCTCNGVAFYVLPCEVRLAHCQPAYNGARLR